jgi:HK97 gp10 family phage protein
MKATFVLKGLDAYLEDLAQAGQDIDAIVTGVLDEARPVAEARMHEILRSTSEQWTGATAETIYTTPVQKDGNFIYFELGANTGDDPSAQYKEYGRIRQKAEPFLRPSLTELRRVGIKKMLKQVFERMGMQTK